MKSSIKLSLVFVVSVSLFVSCSFLLLNAQAQASLEKVGIGDKAIRIQTGQGTPVIDVQLLENTDHCFTECYAVLRLHPYQDIALPQHADSEFAWNFEKARPWMNGLVSYHFEILETVAYEIEVPEYGTVKVNSTCYDQDNATYACEADQTIQTGSHRETEYRDEYRPFAFWGETLISGQDYTIKLVGKKPISTQANNVDWRPLIKGLEIEDWAWWNTTCEQRWRIYSSASISNIPLSVNDTYLFSGNEIWTNNRTENFYVYNCTYDSTPFYPVANDTDQLSWENGSSRTGYNSTGVWEAQIKGVWHLGEMTGTKVYDSTSNANNGTLVNSPSFNSNGLFGGALNFTKSTEDWINVPDSASVRLGNNMTVMAWIKPVDIGGNCISDSCTILSKEMETLNKYPSYQIIIMKQYGVYFGLSLNGNYGTGFWNGTAANVFDGNWHLVAGTYNSSYAIMYIDGVFSSISSYTGGIGYTNEPLNFGKMRDGGTEYYSGDIDEVRIINRTVNATEISEIYRNGINNLTSFEEMPCPSDDTYINQSTKFEPANMVCYSDDLGDSGVLIINASNIVLDCNGMTLDNIYLGQNVAIFNDGFSNVTIKNCKLQNYDEGIYVHSQNSVVENNVLSYNGLAGITVHLSSNVLIKNNTFLSNAYSVNVLSSDEINISHCNISNSDAGIYAENSTGIYVENSVIEESKYCDIDLEEYDNNCNVLNTTYDGDKECIVEGDLTRQWYVKANVTDKNGTAIQNAQVTAKDNFNTTEWTENTSSDGLTGWNIVTQYVNQNGTLTHYTPHTISASHPSYASNSTTQNITESKIVNLMLKNWEITFNVTSGEDGSPLDNVNINCNYSGFNQNDTTNTYGPYEFPTGSWWCKFELWGYYNETTIFNVNNDTNLNVKLSEKKSLTIEEHTWLEWLYDCWNSGNCIDLLQDIGIKTTEINQTSGKIWNQFKRTDQTIVSKEQFVSIVVNSTNNITINYTVNVPVKEGYGLIQGIQYYDDFLPIRINYWFLDETNKTCYSQGNYSISLAEPYCQPLTIYTVGQISTQMNFTTNLRPKLPAGNYTIVRDIEIDPNNEWIDYGQEIIGQIQVSDDNTEISTNIKSSANGIQTISENKAKEEKQGALAETKTSQQPEDKSTGMITVQQIDSISYVAVIISVITLVLVGLMFRNSRKRTYWGG